MKNGAETLYCKSKVTYLSEPETWSYISIAKNNAKNNPQAASTELTLVTWTCWTTWIIFAEIHEEVCFYILNRLPSNGRLTKIPALKKKRVGITHRIHCWCSCMPHTGHGNLLNWRVYLFPNGLGNWNDTFLTDGRKGDQNTWHIRIRS